MPITFFRDSSQQNVALQIPGFAAYKQQNIAMTFGATF